MGETAPCRPLAVVIGAGPGLGIALVAGPIGSFIVWRRMAYFGDTLAHSGLLGVALGILAGIDLTPAIIATCVAVALLLVLLRERQLLAEDTLLGILSHAALASGLIGMDFCSRLNTPPPALINDLS